MTNTEEEKFRSIVNGAVKKAFNDELRLTIKQAVKEITNEHLSFFTQNAINRAYIQARNTVGKKYWKDFDMEWRHPITRETHADNSGYLKRMRPGRYDPDQWVAEHFIEPAVRAIPD